MAPNHGEDLLGSILGPMGSHWVQKMGQNRKKLPCPKIGIFDYPVVIDFSQKMEVTFMAPNQGGDPPRDHLEANWVPLGPKNGSKRRKLPCPKIRIINDLPVIDFSPKMEVTVIAPNHSGDPLGSILGPMGSHWVQKKGQNGKKLQCPKIRIFDYPVVIDFSQKMEVTVIAPNHSGDPLGSILGSMGPHWVKHMGQNRKKLPCRKIRIFHDPAVIDFSQKLEVTVMAPNHGGDPLGSILGYAVIDFSEKMEVTVMARNHGGDPLGSILGPMGSHWVKKMGQNCRKLPCRKIRTVNYPAVIHFSQKMEVTVMAPNHGGDFLGSILGPMGSHWVQKMGQNLKNYHAPKFEFSTTPRSFIFLKKKWKLRLWRQIMVGTF